MDDNQKKEVANLLLTVLTKLYGISSYIKVKKTTNLGAFSIKENSEYLTEIIIKQSAELRRKGDRNELSREDLSEVYHKAVDYKNRLKNGTNAKKYAIVLEQCSDLLEYIKIKVYPSESKNRKIIDLLFEWVDSALMIDKENNNAKILKDLLNEDFKKPITADLDKYHEMVARICDDISKVESENAAKAYLMSADRILVSVFKKEEQPEYVMQKLSSEKVTYPANLGQ
ncbi:hypothetical protein L3V79_08045 [Thiotrichales bacterium 19S9-12]|nr:hypothetical protein [Thiotrichales bacterium 19S9-11]MCF6812303.1 hypothetical protein [Thiotrichales bacterium 19S9-12]